MTHRPRESDIDWNSLEPGTMIHAVSRLGFTLQRIGDLGLNPDLNPGMFGIHMKHGDVAIVLGYDRERRWTHSGLRHIRLYAHEEIGWYDVRALDSMFRVLSPL